LMQLRKKAGLSQEELADKLGVSRQAVSKWECAESSPDTDNLIALSKIYGVTLDELVNGTDSEQAPKAEKKEKEPFVHIKSKDGDEIRVENVNIHVKDDEGSEVHINKDGIKIVEGNNKDDDDDDDDILWKDSKLRKVETVVSSSLPLFVVIAYILLGFLVPLGWRNYWVLFFLIPIVPSLFEAIRRRKFCAFAYPVLIVMIYLTIGMFIGMWHPTWVLFLTIPVYYTIFGPIDAANTKRRIKQKVKITKDIIDNKED